MFCVLSIFAFRLWWRVCDTCVMCFVFTFKFSIAASAEYIQTPAIGRDPPVTPDPPAIMEMGTGVSGFLWQTEESVLLNVSQTRAVIWPRHL